jgi:hypothetical protein
MKKTILSLLALAFAVTMSARPVSQETAQRLAQSFVTANFEFTRQSSDLSLVKTGYSDRGEACYYVFNVGTTGFVILAGDDAVRPVIGYSDKGTFDPDDMAPALVDYLESMRLGIMAEAQKGTGNAEVAADWVMLEECGRLVSRHGGREDEYLVQTTWNQNYPYNYFCPEGEGGPGGHCYAGCVATAAAQVMKYWNHPLQGHGSYTYVPQDHPEYGPLTANFGATIYDWDNMPNHINASSPQVQIEAVAQLIYHAGVSVDMNYRPTSSGAVTGKLCQSMPEYFFYTNNMQNLYREECTREEYMQLIINEIDMGWPMAHRGNGHAYVLDGYNDNDMVHFNWGWGGSSDGWFDIDNHGYVDDESVIYNYVPAAVYAATPDAPTDFVVTPATDGALEATLSWKNPTKNLSNTNLTVIDQIVVERNGQVVYSEDNVAPGAEMSFVDESVPYYDNFKYVVYAVSDGQRGVSAYAEDILVSPTCNWKIVMQSSAFQGWNGGYVSLYSATGKEVARYTMTNSSPISLNIPVMVGKVSFGWTAPNQVVSNMSFVIKDSEGNSLYTYSGNSSGLEAGIFLRANNDCGSGQLEETPYGLVSHVSSNNAVLTWNCDSNPYYGYNIYCDGHLIALVREGKTYTDENITTGHCYTVRALGEGGESEDSNETCASAGDCMAASNFFFEYFGDNYKIKLTWDTPANNEGLSGYTLYRKYGDEEDYQRIKLLGPNVTSYKDNTANVEGDYYYRLYAYYSATDCTSAPASVLYHPNLFYLHVYYSPTDVYESVEQAVSLYPNPADHSLTLEAEGMTQVTICNVLGQVVFESELDDNTLKVNTFDWNEGLYLATIRTKNGTITKRVSIVH